MILEFKIPDFYLTSSWKCAKKDTNKYVVAQFEISVKPNTASATKSVSYSIASGAKVRSAKVQFTTGEVASGISVLRINGSSSVQRNGNVRSVPITLTANSGTVFIKFEFRANGKVFNDENTHLASMTFKNVSLVVDYEDSGPGTVSQPTLKKSDSVFSVPPQSVCIYDQDDGSVYLFDGVAKVQHNLTLDLQEDPDSKKAKQYINNAKNQPDKLTLDVVMSDVYSGGGAIITKAEDAGSDQNKAGTATSSYLMNPYVAKSSWTRSEAAFHTLHYLKESRKKLSVITPQYVHVDMLLASVTVNHDDETPFGWQGQIVFQHAFEPKEKKKTTPTKDPGNGVIPPTEAGLPEMSNNSSRSGNAAVTMDTTSRVISASDAAKTTGGKALPSGVKRAD